MKFFKSKFFIILFFIITILFFYNKFFYKNNISVENEEEEIKIEKQTKMIFGWMSDIHLGDNNHADKLATLGDDAIKRVMPKIIDHKAEFVVITGDMIDNFHKNHDEVIGFHKEVKRLFDQYPLDNYFVIGNHDVQTTSKEEVKEIYGLENENYVFKKSGITFIVIDQQFNPDGSSYDEGEEHYLQGAIHENQLKWVEEELNNATGKAIILSHQPIFAITSEDNGGGFVELYNGQKLNDILEKSRKVLAVLSGHKQANKDEMKRKFGSIKHFILPSAIFKDTRLSHGIIEIDLNNYEIKFDYYMDENQIELTKELDEIAEKCRGKDEENDYYTLIGLKERNPEQFNQIQALFKKYKDIDFKNSQELSIVEIQQLRDFEDFDCYGKYLELRKEFSGY